MYIKKKAIIIYIIYRHIPLMINLEILPFINPLGSMRFVPPVNLDMAPPPIATSNGNVQKMKKSKLAPKFKNKS